MAEILQPDDLAAWLRRLESRVAALESAGRPSFVPMVASVWNDYQITTSNDWVPLYNVRLDVVIGTTLQIELTSYTDVGTMGEWRFQVMNVTGQPLSTTTVPISSTPNTSWNFLGGADELIYGNLGVRIEIQARRTAGAGSVYLGWPSRAWNGLSISTGG